MHEPTSDPPLWEVVASEELQDCAVFRVRRDHARSPRTGQIHAFYGIEADGWVNVVPVTNSGEVVMVRQYRHGTRELTLEIPGGIIDPGETPVEAAGRELLEETGYAGGHLVPLGSVNPNPALFANRVHTFIARGVELRQAIQQSGTEETAVVLLPVDSVRNAIESGQIDHALVVVALCRWLLEGEANSMATQGTA
jgi:8-oxo-dGTP pyrophosphatase MutT (NUDIX family)